MRLANFLVLYFFSCALSSKSRSENDKEEFYAKIQISNYEVSGKGEQLFSTSTDAWRKKLNISAERSPLIRDTRETAANITYFVGAARFKHVQKLPKKETEAGANVLQPGDSSGTTYIPTKEANQTRNVIRREFLNASRISDNSAITRSAGRERKGEERGENGRMKNKFAREEEFYSASLAESANVQSNIAESSISAPPRNSAPRAHKVKCFKEQNCDVQANEGSSAGGILPEAEKYIAENADENYIRMVNVIAENATSNSANLENGKHTQGESSRSDQKEKWEPAEADYTEAANFGLQAMHNLYYVQEPKLYSMGLYLGKDDPARYVAAFNDQSEEARDLARFGYAALQSTAVFLKKFPSASLVSSLSRSTRRTQLQQQCPRRGTPQCPPASLRYRTSDGSCNNPQHLWWGSAMSAMQRFLPAMYRDGVQSVRRSKNGTPLPSARDVTSSIHEDRDVPLAFVTHMLMQWGQFVDHDLTATGQSRGFNGTIPQCCLPGGVGFQPPEFMHPDCLPIAVNLRDSFYGPLGVRCLEFLRSGPAPKEGCEFGTREQLSQVTSYLDASMVYSSNALLSDSLRIFRSGLLQYGRIQSRRPSLPKFEFDLCRLGSLSTTCFRAGDGRLSEQPALTSLHVVFLRLHNRIATELSTLNSHWSDEKLFQETRRIVGAVVQHITYREFLPIVLGPQVMKIFDLEVLKKGYYEGYDPTVDPTVANAFSTAAYRFGHSLVQRSFVRFDSDHRPLFDNVSIHDEFQNSANLETAGSVDRLLLGLVNQPCQRRDEFITEEMTNHLFQTPAFAFGMDLASINIQRGRDHGLPPYVRWREPCGLSPIKTFEDLDRVMSPNTARKFKSLYSSVQDIDLFPAGLAEKSVLGGLVGPTFACIIGQQFSNLRRGDRFWYENSKSESSFAADQLQQIRRVSLAQVLCRTIDSIDTVQPFVFLATDTLKNQRVSCDDPVIGHLNLESWAERQSGESRHNVDDNVADPPEIKRTTSDSDNPSISRSKQETTTTRKGIEEKGHRQQMMNRPQKPFKASVNQNNRIVFKRPFGRPSDNLTIVVQNNAVNSPVFINEGVLGSHVRLQPPVGRPISNPNQGVNHYRPQTKPIPTTIPHSASFHAARPYVPYSFDDPSNPNPPAYGYKSPAASAQNIVLYDNYSATSPRPTLYTYYTSFQQKSTTRAPEVDGYLINHGTSYHEHNPLSAHYGRPELAANSDHLYGFNSEQKPGQKPNYDVIPRPSANTRPNSRPNYASHYESYDAHKFDYGGLKSPTSSRPNFGSNYESYDKPYHEQKLDYNRPRPTYSINSGSNNGLYHAQKPVYGGSVTLAILRPNFTPNHQSNQLYGATKPSDVDNTCLHSNENFDKRPNDGYSTNSNKPRRCQQGQWNSNDYNDPDLYHKRPNYSAQSGLYSGSPTNFPSYKEDTYASNSNASSFAHSKGSAVSNDNYDKYPATTPIYPSKRPTAAQNSWVDISSYVTKSTTLSHGSPFYQKPTSSRPYYQKDNQSHLFSHPKESIDIPHATEANDSHRKTINVSILNDQLLSSTSRPTWYSSKTSTIDLQAHGEQESLGSKPTKVQSVTIVTEAIEIVRHPGHSGYIPQRQTTGEVPRPLPQKIKTNTPIIRKPGQYYYEKNVLHRYPDEVVDQIPKSNPYSTNESEKTSIRDRVMLHDSATSPEKISVETSTIHDFVVTDSPNIAIPSNESESTSTPTFTITNYNNGGDAKNDLEGAFMVAENVATADVPDRLDRWTNSQDFQDSELPSMLEMPRIPTHEFASVNELPKPIKLRNYFN